MQTPRVTLRELAELSGVNVSTVSRALTGDPRISEARRAEINELAERNGYRPQPFRRARKNALALLITTDAGIPIDPYYQTRLAGVFSKITDEAGYHLHLRVVSRDDTLLSLPPIVHEQRVDGVILAGHPSQELCRALRRNKVPAVVLDDTQERTGLTSFRNEFEAAMQGVVEHLVELGHRRLAFCATNRSWPTVEARLRGFLSCADAELSCRTVSGFSPDMTGGREGLCQLLAAESPSTAIIFVNDWMALGALLEASQRGIEVPRQISLIGFDNTPICEDVRPTLSSVDLCLEERARKAIEELDRQVENYHVSPDTVLGCRLEWRDSTGPAVM